MQAPVAKKQWNLPSAERIALLDALDGGVIGSDPGMDTLHRASFRIGPTELGVTHVAGGSASFTVFPRNIGPKGMAILHAGYLHEHTDCQISLPTVWNAKETVRATVRRCRHVGGLIHDVELEFLGNVDVRWFIERGPELTRVLTQDADKSQIHGRILVLDDENIALELIRFHLRGTGLTIEGFKTPGEVLDHLRTHSFDLMLCDLNLAHERGEKVIAQIRSQQCTAPILALTGETDPQRLAAATEAGANAILSKPLEAKSLLDAVVEWLSEKVTSREADQALIHSTIAGSADGDHLVRTFLDYVARQMSALQRGIEQGSLPEVRDICLGLKENCGTAGFACASDAAAAAIRALDASASIMESLSVINELRSMCGRLRPDQAPKPGEPAPAP